MKAAGDLTEFLPPTPQQAGKRDAEAAGGEAQPGKPHALADTVGEAFTFEGERAEQLPGNALQCKSETCFHICSHRAGAGRQRITRSADGTTPPGMILIFGNATYSTRIGIFQKTASMLAIIFGRDSNPAPHDTHNQASTFSSSTVRQRTAFNPGK
jgi:hypothetical protein